MRWLQLSDFHVGKDQYAQRKLFKYILNHMKTQKEKGFSPDCIFITGDIANSGQKEEYVNFEEEFLLKIVDIYEKELPIYIVPGNHDLNRKKATIAGESLHNILQKKPEFFDTDEIGLEIRREIFDRFADFSSSGMEIITYPIKGIFGEKASYHSILEINGKRIGIVGINTAWLCRSDEDKEKLTPGKYVVEEALEEIKSCDYKFVLGHHPLSWYDSQQRQQISKLFADNRVIYLHGHLHRNSGEYALAVDKGFLSIQSGASFQAREDEKNYNSLLWGELNMDTDKVILMPRRWSKKEQDFVLDTSEHLPEYFRKEGRDYWEFPILCRMAEDRKQEREKIKMPNGWHLISKEFIEKERRKPIDEDKILKFFDGKEPGYAEVFSSKIPIREVTERVKKEFEDASKEGMVKCKIVVGAGGEGKTTFMFQTVMLLVEQSNFQGIILKHPEENQELQEKTIRKITREGNWIIAIDHSHAVIEKIYHIAKNFELTGKTNVHFLICMRDVDWNHSNADRFEWEKLEGYSKVRMRGISETDAQKFVQAWSDFGERGLGKLKELSIEEAKQKLLEASLGEEKREPEEGALLGAMLVIRYGDDLKNHVREILQKLKSIKLFNSNLLDAFAYITAIHSEKLSLLSKIVLAELYQCKESEVKRYILGPLADEAVSSVSGNIIYSRHLFIAKAAREILDKEFYYDFDELFVELTLAAIEAKRKGKFVEDYRQWKFISEHFANKEENSLAIRLDQEILKQNPTDDYVMVHLSKLFRKVDQSDMALQLFREIDYSIERRPVFCEWALVEANEDNKMISICLSAVALSDQIEKVPIDIKNACMNLYSISLTFIELYHKYVDNTYLDAAQAAAEIGRKIDLNNDNIKRLFKTNRNVFETKEYPIEQAVLFKNLERGIVKAAGKKEYILKDWISKIEALTYEGLINLSGKGNMNV